MIKMKFVANFFKKKCLAPYPPSSEDFFIEKICEKYTIQIKNPPQKWRIPY